MTKTENVWHRKAKDMSLREKIGQLFVCGFPGLAPDDGIRELISDYGLGGVICFRRNVSDPEQVRRLTEALQAEARSAGQPPLWIAIDQEGGMVARIDAGVTVMPGSMAIGACGDPDAAYRAALGSGRELRAMGINFNFAPCLDVNNNADNPVIGVRSFGESPEAVANLGMRQIRGYRDAGVAAAAKHFPGHGDTATDSHHEVPVVPHARERLEQVELLPFRTAIAGGVDAIMTAHVVFPAYEPDGIPATVSPRVIDGLLRRTLGYDGVIITDCLEMNAISDTLGVAEGAVAALAAGVDLVLVSHRHDRQKAALEAVYEAVRSGRLDEARINASVDRILRLKAARRIGEGTAKSEAELRRRLLTGDTLATASGICARSVTLVHDKGGALPLSGKRKTLVIWPEVRAATEIDEIIPQELTLGRALSDLLPDVTELRIGVEPMRQEMENAMAAAAQAEQIVMVTYNAHLVAAQRELAAKLAELPGKSVTAVAARNPYDLLALPEVSAYLACYENRPLMMRAVADVLAGRRRPEGRLPVSLGEDYPRGWSVTP
ncbi:beta-N-acetylhexosaminidase [Paenibacillus thermoaerophilus]|uniref:Beta-N-acetylhexosaminidase n=1 Tax=Paenibacillus thermoaerophilus TaxID=1215385 RepID=A0ABW2V535_9BACL|nr:beta-N-acetylhexosaminidase [Paenibacillus thermoaerophilus]TMV17935.1 beta-N-acetylhexosaminidase [Paenibacillus thermoaerophilus]